MKIFRESELGQIISTAYEVRGTPDVLLAEVVMTAHPGWRYETKKSYRRGAFGRWDESWNIAKA